MSDVAAAFAQRNAPYVARQGSYTTDLQPLDDMVFRSWVQRNKVPFDPNQQRPDYDMRGFWAASQNPAIWGLLQGVGAVPPDMAPASTRIDPNDGKPHYPDFWKTPFHETFSGESQFAKPVAPMWNARDQLVSPGGRILFDDRARR